MTNAFSRNRADSLVDWGASLLFAALVGYACLMLGGAKVAWAGAVAASTSGLFALSCISPAQCSLPDFAVDRFDDVVDEQDVLLLDDALEAPASSSRVVKLFAAGESSPAVLVARIEDYLGRDPEKPVRSAPGGEGSGPSADASAALHAALSNIRASLR